MQPEAWIELLYIYGPFALLVFFAFVTEKKSRAALQKADEMNKKALLSVYIVNWVAIFFLLAFCCYAWYKINLHTDPTIEGSFEGLRGDESVSSLSTDLDLYLSKDFKGSFGFNYDWRLVSREQLKDGDTFRFGFSRGGDDPRDTIHDVPIKSSFYDSSVRIFYKRDEDTFELEHKGETQKLLGRADIASVATSQAAGFFSRVVYAAEMYSPEELIRLLGSSDAMIRRRARAALAQQGPDALPAIEKVLADADASYRLTLGVLVALNQMRNLSSDSLSRSAYASIEKRARDKDPTVRSQAALFLNYVWIPPGTFQMGCVPGDDDCDDDEKRRRPHRVEITKSFWMGRTEVEVKAYKEFAEIRGLQMPSDPNFNRNWAKDNHPIINVSWAQANDYCKWAGGRLPTEAEWEYTARSGKEGLKYPWGNEPSPQNAKYDSKDGTIPVGSFPPNYYGLYDMAGNVSEWVADWYQKDYYSKSPSTDPPGPLPGPPSGIRRVFRGGSWSDDPEKLRSSYRGAKNSGRRDNEIGFRCAREVSP